MTTTPAPTPKRGGNRILYILIGLIVTCVVSIGVAALILSKAFNVFSTPQNFMNDVMKGDYNSAYSLIYPSAQAQFGGSADGLQQFITSKGWQPTRFNTSGLSLDNAMIVKGSGTFGGTTRYAYFTLRLDGIDWKIVGLDVIPNSDNHP